MKYLRILHLCCCIGGFGYALPQGIAQVLDSTQQTAMQVFQLRLQIDAATDKGKYMQALGYWVDVLELEPDNPAHYLERSKLFQRINDYPAALSDCHSLIRLDPQNYQSYWRRAEIYFIQRKFSHALADLDRALEYADEHSGARYAILFDRGFCKEQQLQFRSAIADYLRLLQSDNPKQNKALHHLGIAYNGLAMRDSSIFYLKKLIWEQPDYVGAYISLSYTYTDMEDYNTAIQLLNRALQLADSQPYQRALSLNNRGYCKLKTDDQQGAKRDLWQAARLLPHHPSIHRNKAVWYMLQGQQAAACRQWRLAQSYGYEEMYGSEVNEAIEQFCDRP